MSDDSPRRLREKAEKSLQDIQRWFLANRLQLNSEKNTVQGILSRNRPVPIIVNKIILNQQEIQRSHAVKYLGLIVDDQLSWKTHVDELEKELIRTISSFKIIRRWIPAKAKLKLYNAYVNSKIIYGILINLYGTSPKTMLKKIQVHVLQNRAIKILYGLDSLTPTK